MQPAAASAAWRKDSRFQPANGTIRRNPSEPSTEPGPSRRKSFKVQRPTPDERGEDRPGFRESSATHWALGVGLWALGVGRWALKVRLGSLSVSTYFNSVRPVPRDGP